MNNVEDNEGDRVLRMKSVKIENWDLEKLELSPDIGSGSWKDSKVHPLYRLWDVEERIRVVVYRFFPI